MLEAEWAFPQSGVHGVCDLTEALLKDVVQGVLESEDVNVLWGQDDSGRREILREAFAKQTPWTKISYTEAVRELEAAKPAIPFEFTPKWGQSLQSEHEKWLAEQLIRGPVFVTDYPAAMKPFYMRANDDSQTVACFDLLIPHVGEMIGGSVREERADVLKEKMADVTGADWYLDLRKFGSAPHAGFGMGFERLVSWVSGVENIRECIPIPRWSGRMLL